MGDGDSVKSDVKGSSKELFVKSSAEKDDVDPSSSLVSSTNISKSDIKDFLISIEGSTSPCAVLFREGRLSGLHLHNIHPMFKDAGNFVKNPALCTLYKMLLGEYGMLAHALKGMDIKINMQGTEVVLSRNYEFCFSGYSKVSAQAKLKDKAELHAKLDCLFRALLLVLVEDHKIASNTDGVKVLEKGKGTNSGFKPKATEAIKKNVSIDDSSSIKGDVNLNTATNSDLLAPISGHLKNIGDKSEYVSSDLASLILAGISDTIKDSISKIEINTPTSGTFTLVEALFNIIDVPLERLLACIKSDEIRSRVKDILSSIIKAAIGIGVAYASSYISAKLSVITSAIKTILQ